MATIRAPRRCELQAELTARAKLDCRADPPIPDPQRLNARLELTTFVTGPCQALPDSCLVDVIARSHPGPSARASYAHSEQKVHSAHESFLSQTSVPPSTLRAPSATRASTFNTGIVFVMSAEGAD